ncbi:MAG: gliding motility-associated C-terminal domain-containing protein [Flavobacteriaceae bacterium]|nr:gliding motility-associated C-terminal domain-containing protein [Flavobacteriaceae bacterium]
MNEVKMNKVENPDSFTFKFEAIANETSEIKNIVINRMVTLVSGKSTSEKTDYTFTWTGGGKAVLISPRGLMTINNDEVNIDGLDSFEEEKLYFLSGETIHFRPDLNSEGGESSENTSSEQWQIKIPSDNVEIVAVAIEKTSSGDWLYNEWISFDVEMVDVKLSDFTICESSEAIINMSYSKRNYSYQLRIDDQPIGRPVTGTGKSIAFDSVSPIVDTQYNVLATWTDEKMQVNNVEVVDKANITVLNTLSPIISKYNQSFCGSAKISDLDIAGTEILWYLSADDINPLDNNLDIVDGATYYASQTINGCESTDRSAVFVKINPIPSTSEIEIVQNCGEDAAIVTIINQTSGSLYSFDNGIAYQSENYKNINTGIEYNLKVKNIFGCESISKKIIVNYYVCPIVDDALIIYELGKSIDIDISSYVVEANDIMLSSICFGEGIDTNDDSTFDMLIVEGEGIWTVDCNTGIVVFTPEEGFLSDPSPITYQIKDSKDNITTATITIISETEPELYIIKVSDKQDIWIDDEVVFTIKVTNKGLKTVTNINIEETLRNGYTYVSHSTDIGSYDTISNWNIPVLLSNQEASLILSAKVNNDGNTDYGDYSNTATILDYSGNNSASVELNLIGLTIYNQFSPNSDGVNDFFEIKGLSNFPENSIEIFNRWGNTVYYKKGYDNTWNGVSNKAKVGESSSKLPNGTYFYILDLGNNQIKTDWLYLKK